MIHNQSPAAAALLSHGPISLSLPHVHAATNLYLKSKRLMGVKCDAVGGVFLPPPFYADGARITVKYIHRIFFYQLCTSQFLCESCRPRSFDVIAVLLFFLFRDCDTPYCARFSTRRCQHTHRARGEMGNIIRMHNAGMTIV